MTATNPRRRARPSTRSGWYRWYAAEYNRTRDPQAAQLACWYLTLFLAFGDDR